MLQTLRIRNVAIVERAEVEFTPGLNVVTGETGAGKSILVGSLGLVLGDRADRTIIRTGEEQCGVEAVFTLADPAGVDAVLESLGLPPTEEGRLVVRRIVSASGGGRNWINDSPTTAQALKRVGELLVDMHGPHDHQSLLSSSFQMDLLDAFGRLHAARAEYEALYAELVRLERERRTLEGEDEQRVSEQLDLAAYQVKELEEARLTPADEAELEQEHARVANAQQILELAGAARAALTEDEGAAVNAVASALRSLTSLARLDAQAAAWQAEAESVSIQVRELSAALGDYAGRIEADPARLQWLEDRMALVHKLKRKYGGSVEQALAALDRARERLKELQSRGERARDLAAQADAVRAQLLRSGARLGRGRRETAGRLAAAITESLRSLGFPHGAFTVDLREEEPGPSGMDAIEFGFAPNVGEAARPLRAIASSGEISRVMLAVKAVLALHDRIPLLVFDEIDANVGGEMGRAIGVKLGAIAQHHQVLCITHLPQVAVHGTTHWVVTKDVRDGRTVVRVSAVAGDARAEEVARMLGGKDAAGVALRHAREMLRRA